MRNTKVTDFKQLTMMSDEFMSAMFKDDTKIVGYVLSIVLDKKITVLEVKVHEETINLSKKRIFFDVYAIDDKKQYYDIEIQRSDIGADRRRARYHSSAIDSRLMKKGEKDWSKLPEQYVIFFTEHDVLGMNIPIYHIERVIMESQNQLFNDGEHIIYVNCAYKNTNGSDLEKLIHDFNCVNSNDMYSLELANKMNYLKDTNSLGGKSMGRWSENLIEIGEKSGKKAAFEQVATNLIQRGMDLESIKDITSLSNKKIQQLQDKIKKENKQ